MSQQQTRRELMAERDQALKSGDITRFQALTKQIAELPLAGVPPLSEHEISKYVNRKQR